MLAKNFLFLLFLITVFFGCSDIKVDQEIISYKENLPDVIDFNLHVKPILSDRCFACHGPDKNSLKAGLRLDDPEIAFATLESNKKAIVPHSTRKSEMLRRILSDDPDLVMPPRESNLILTPEEKAILIKWIEQGAEYKEHWSFITPTKAEIPEVKNEKWVINEIDHFILSKLEKLNISPSEKATKETLIRRLSFDLTGLPPSIDEIDDFLNDKSKNAYEKVVDRLLSSPHYGERVAVDWLDLARYADSHGYQDDKLRRMWPWRDWVIKAFNDNMRYDEFVKLQLGGDLIPGAGKNEILPTAFNRNHMQTQEGGVEDEEYRVEYVADRTNTLGTAFLGITLECARCHDHKYDPISQKDYFKMYGFFNNIHERGEIPYTGEASPSLFLTTDIAEESLGEIKQYIKNLDKNLNPKSEEPEFEKWLTNFMNEGSKTITPDKMIVHETFDKPEYKENKGKFGYAFLCKEENSYQIKDDRIYFERYDPFSLTFYVNVSKLKEGPLITRTAGIYNGDRGYEIVLDDEGKVNARISHVYPGNAISIKTLKPIRTKEWVHISLTYDGSSKAKGLKLFLNGELEPVEIHDDELTMSIIGYGPERSNWENFHFPLRLGKTFMATMTDVLVDDLKVFTKQLSQLEIKSVSGNPIQIKSSDKISGNIKDLLFEHYRINYSKSYAQNRNELRKLLIKETKIHDTIPQIMVMKERLIPRQTFLLARGEYDAPSEKVEPGVPENILPFSSDLPQNRMGLANWLFNPDHPLTSRVAVNRYWQMIFGRGIVKTPDDFGNQGALPTHPELLDYLAIKFIESGWDVKALIKSMVMTATYQQSSVTPKHLLESDPDNDLYARGASYRMSAESIRDNALASSGLLVKKIGGPSVKPYQPAGIWEALSANRNDASYVQDTGDNLYRRALYTLWKRTAPPPSMVTFDVPDRGLCAVKRQKTSTPLQALVLLNDPQYLEAARVMAQNVAREKGDIQKQIEVSFRRITSRYPDNKEMDLLLRLYNEEYKAYKDQPKLALELISVGEYPMLKGIDAAHLAALTVVNNTLISLDDAVFRR